MKNEPTLKFNQKIYQGTETLESMNQAKFYNNWSLEKFKKFLRGKIIEVGCGLGNFTYDLSKYGEVVGIDIEKEFIAKQQACLIAKQQACLINNFKKNGNDRIKVGYGDIEKGEYFFKNATFDTVVCINVLEHIKEDKKALENLYSLLNKNGHLILLVPAYRFLYGEIDKNIGHYRRYEPDNLDSKLKNLGLTIVKSRKLNFLGAIGWFIAGKILKNKQINEKKIKLFNLISPLLLFFENIIEPPMGISVLIVAKKE